MQMLFSLVHDIPVPQFDTDPAGVDRKPDGQELLTLKQTAKKTGLSQGQLKDIYQKWIGDIQQPEVPSAATSLGRFTETPRQLAIFARMYCPHFTDEQVEEALELCRGANLNPFARQVFFKLIYNTESRRMEVVAMTTIAGLRNRAGRNAKYGSQSQPWWCGEDGDWRDVWLDACPPSACKIEITPRGGHPTTTVVHWVEFAPSLTDEETGVVEVIDPLWKSKPAFALAKVAEACGLRRAYPAECDGLYISEEMDRAVQQTSKATAAAAKRPETVEHREFDDTLPQTLSQLKLAMIDRLGISGPDADHRIADAKRTYAALHQTSEAGFCARVFRDAERYERLRPRPRPLQVV